MRILFLCFLTVPIIEMLVLIEVGSFIGTLYTILLVLLTAVIGVSLLKRQGLSTFVKANQKMQTGQMPVAEMGEGLMLAVAGALLLTPGFVTDTVGFILLTPGLRSTIAKTFIKQMLKNSQQSTFYSQSTFGSTTRRSTTSQTNSNPFSSHERRQNNASSDVIEGEYQDVSASREDQALGANKEKDQ